MSDPITPNRDNDLFIEGENCDIEILSISQRPDGSFCVLVKAHPAPEKKRHRYIKGDGYIPKRKDGYDTPPIFPGHCEWGDGFVAGWCAYQDKLDEERSLCKDGKRKSKNL